SDTPLPAGINLDIQLVMTDRTLLDGDPEPAHLIGYGAIPAPLARRLVTDADPRTRTWIRRLYTDPITGHLTDGDRKPPPILRRRPRLHHRPRPDLPHPLVRRPDPAHRPRRRPRRRRPHHPAQRPGPVRGLQPNQGSRRLAPPTRPRPARPGHHHHPHRPHPHQPATVATPISPLAHHRVP